MKKQNLESVATLLAAVFLIGLFAAFFALPTQLLWNKCLSPAIDGVNQIGFFQALGINMLSSILFKNSTFKKND